MADYKETPERKAEMDLLFRLNDASQSGQRAMLPPPGFGFLQLKYAQEDEILDEFGELRTFDWTLTDDGPGRVEVKGISTSIEAVSKAVELWKAMGYQIDGQIHARRSDGKRFD